MPTSRSMALFNSAFALASRHRDKLMWHAHQDGQLGRCADETMARHSRQGRRVRRGDSLDLMRMATGFASFTSSAKCSSFSGRSTHTASLPHGVAKARRVNTIGSRGICFPAAFRGKSCVTAQIDSAGWVASRALAPTETAIVAGTSAARYQRRRPALAASNVGRRSLC